MILASCVGWSVGGLIRITGEEITELQYPKKRILVRRPEAGDKAYIENQKVGLHHSVTYIGALMGNAMQELCIPGTSPLIVIPLAL